MNIKSLCIAIACTVTCVFVFAQSPKGEIKPGPLHHTPESALGLISQAQVGLPTSVTGGQSMLARFQNHPSQTTPKFPLFFLCTALQA